MDGALIDELMSSDGMALINIEGHNKIISMLDNIFFKVEGKALRKGLTGALLKFGRERD